MHQSTIASGEFLKVVILRQTLIFWQNPLAETNPLADPNPPTDPTPQADPNPLANPNPQADPNLPVDPIILWQTLIRFQQIRAKGSKIRVGEQAQTIFSLHLNDIKEQQTGLAAAKKWTVNLDWSLRTGR